ncbi:hypothetical protein RRG08_052714 [Elysia crispata]|uniref:Uncharacterized protein n=1 Tax=Elysia crispata TaxID=231223 RepID=A0AAE1EAI2_9GAST|nr:hypothetical protein RRG08_052714 [Elysia crispata]
MSCCVCGRRVIRQVRHANMRKHLVEKIPRVPPLLSIFELDVNVSRSYTLDSRRSSHAHTISVTLLEELVHEGLDPPFRIVESTRIINFEPFSSTSSLEGNEPQQRSLIVDSL